MYLDDHCFNILSNLNPALISLFSESSFLIWFSSGGYISEVNRQGRELFRSILLLKDVIYIDVMYTL